MFITQVISTSLKLKKSFMPKEKKNTNIVSEPEAAYKKVNPAIFLF